MNKKIIAGAILGFWMARAALADDPAKIEFRLTQPILRPLEPTLSTAPARKPGVATIDRTTSPETFTLSPGTYTCVPYSMIVVVPAPMDEGMIKRPGTLPTTRTFQPPATFVPTPH